MLKEMEKAKGGLPYQKPTGSIKEPVGKVTPTLADIGISRKQSSNWQKIAEIPEKRAGLADNNQDLSVSIKKGRFG